MSDADATPLKHMTIAATLEREIRSGSVPRGRQLPGENTLAERFSVSRNTVRQALSELNRAGLIATRSGKGSFVTFDGSVLDVQQGWAVALENRGVRSTVELLRLEPVTDDSLAARIGCESANFIAIDRLRRLHDGTAISYERSRVPAVGSLVDLPVTGLIDGSLTSTLFAAGLVGECGDQWVSVRELTEKEASVLDRSTAETFLQSTRVSRTSGGDLVEHVESALDPAHFQLHLQFS